MKLSKFKSALKTIDEVKFKLSNGEYVPLNFHVTEIGSVEKNFIDCGGKLRKEAKISMQLWDTIDYDHRLKADKLLRIIELAERKLSIGDDEIEVEYQKETIGKFNLEFENGDFLLVSTKTACLASADCGVPMDKIKQVIAKVSSECCGPNSSCC